MRRFVAAALGAVALSATVFATSGTASAASGSQVANPGGDGARLSALSATTGRTATAGRLHRFSLRPVPGASVWGDWYWTKSNGRSFVIIDYYIKDTKANGKSAGFCFDLKSPTVNLKNKCYVSRYGYGKTDHVIWQMGTWNQDKLRVRSAVGRLDAKAHIFYTSALGPWLVLH